MPFEVNMLICLFHPTRVAMGYRYIKAQAFNRLHSYETTKAICC